MTTAYQLRHAPAISWGDTSTHGGTVFSTSSRWTRSGCASAITNAVAPPQSWPTTWARSISSESSSAIASEAKVTGS